MQRPGQEPLRYYSLGRGSQTVVIMNAPGHDLDQWAPVRDELMHRFHVLAWQARDAADGHVEDMRAILAQEQVSSAHLLTSTAPGIALQFHAAHPGRVTSMAFVSGRIAGGRERLEPAAIDVPTLFLNGDGDQLVPPQATCALAGQVPGAIYAEVAGASHCVHQEFPELVGSLMREFFRRGYEFALEIAGVRIERFLEGRSVAPREALAARVSPMRSLLPA